jgi:hypothetical protein
LAGMLGGTSLTRKREGMQAMHEYYPGCDARHFITHVKVYSSRIHCDPGIIFQAGTRMQFLSIELSRLLLELKQ